MTQLNSIIKKQYKYLKKETSEKVVKNNQHHNKIPRIEEHTNPKILYMEKPTSTPPSSICGTKMPRMQKETYYRTPALTQTPIMVTKEPMVVEVEKVQVIGVGMPFEVLREMGTNNICLKQGEKSIPYTPVTDSLFLVVGSLLFPQMLLGGVDVGFSI